MKTFVTIPTFNESKNIEPLIREIRCQDPEINIVVADDDSPDGTWKIVDEISKKDPRVFLLRRTSNKGRGSAGVDAFRFALQQGADVVVEMDADFSHDPKHIPRFLEKIRECDLVIGSRAVSRWTGSTEIPTPEMDHPLLHVLHEIDPRASRQGLQFRISMFPAESPRGRESRHLPLEGTLHCPGAAL